MKDKKPLKLEMLHFRQNIKQQNSKIQDVLLTLPFNKDLLRIFFNTISKKTTPKIKEINSTKTLSRNLEIK